MFYTKTMQSNFDVIAFLFYNNNIRYESEIDAVLETGIDIYSVESQASSSNCTRSIVFQMTPIMI